MELNEEQYDKVLSALERRAYRSRLATIVFLYFMLSLFIGFFGTIAYVKIKSKSAENNLLTTIFNPKEVNSTRLLVDEIRNVSEELTKAANYAKSTNDLSSSIMTSGASLDKLTTTPKNSIDKAIDTIAPILLILSGLLFIGYIMRIFIVFIKYNMQMSNDYDNQKISFLLSNGNTNEFSEILQKLRNHNISFENTPVLPQEKIINGLLELLKSSKAKN